MVDSGKNASQRRKPPKISVIGTGMVGASLAYSLIVERVAGEVALVDVAKDRAAGEAMDINHAVPFSAPTRVISGDYEACRDTDVFVITAGVPQKPGETRLDLVNKNVEILKDILPRIMKVAEHPIIVIVSNPVDILTYVTIKLSGLDYRAVVGSGTVLDTARLRYELGAHCSVDPRNVHAYILGEHGDTEVPIWSLANVGGLQYEDFCRSCARCPDRVNFTKVFERVRNAAYEIIRLKGATYWAIALGATRMLEAILRNQNTVMTASVLAQGQYGIEDVCLSLPVILGNEGISQIMEIPLNEMERAALRHSADTLKGTLKKVGF